MARRTSSALVFHQGSRGHCRGCSDGDFYDMGDEFMIATGPRKVASTGLSSLKLMRHAVCNKCLDFTLTTPTQFSGMNQTRKRNRQTSTPHRGLTLLELITVVAILAVLAGLVMPMVANVNSQTSDTATRHSLRQVRDVIVHRYYLETGLLPQRHANDSSRPQVPQLCFLALNPYRYPFGGYSSVPDFDPVTRTGWNGPYLMTSGSVYPDPTAVKALDNAGRTWSDLGFTSTYGLANDFTVLDGWGSPIVVRINGVGLQPDHLITTAPVAGSVTLANAVLVSAGPDGELGTLDDVTLKLQN